jgi:hypothetical protein
VPADTLYTLLKDRSATTVHLLAGGWPMSEDLTPRYEHPST